MGKFKEEDLAWEGKAREGVMDWLVKTTPLGFDRWATLEEERDQHFDAIMNGERVEIKVRRPKYRKKRDILIEVISNVARKTPGWIHTTKAKYLVYVFMGRNYQVSRGYILHFHDLKEWWNNEGRLNQYETITGKTEDMYETDNRAVPLKAIPLEIFYYHQDYGLLDYQEGYKIE